MTELEIFIEELCKKGKAYRAKRIRAGEKSSAYLSGRAVKVCKGQMQGESEEKAEGKLKTPYRKSGYMGYSEPVKEIEADDDTEFKVSLKHLLKKHVNKGGEIEEDMSIQEVLDINIIDEDITEAKYKGKTVTLNKPTRGDSKKFKVYVNSGKKNADGSIKVKKVNFGHGGTSAKKRGEKTMKIRKSNPKARSAFRARHNCNNPGPKTMARYWSCKKW